MQASTHERSRGHVLRAGAGWAANQLARSQSAVVVRSRPVRELDEVRDLVDGVHADRLAGRERRREAVVPLAEHLRALVVGDAVDPVEHEVEERPHPLHSNPNRGDSPSMCRSDRPVPSDSSRTSCEVGALIDGDAGVLGLRERAHARVGRETPAVDVAVVSREVRRRRSGRSPRRGTRARRRRCRRRGSCGTASPSTSARWRSLSRSNAVTSTRLLELRECPLAEHAYELPLRDSRRRSRRRTPSRIPDVVEEAVGEDGFRVVLVQSSRSSATSIPAASASAISPPVDVPAQGTRLGQAILRARAPRTAAPSRSPERHLGRHHRQQQDLRNAHVSTSCATERYGTRMTCTHESETTERSCSYEIADAQRPHQLHQAALARCEGGDRVVSGTTDRRFRARL